MRDRGGGGAFVLELGVDGDAGEVGESSKGCESSLDVGGRAIYEGTGLRLSELVRL